VVFAATALFVLTQAAWATTCDRACLLEHAKQFNAAMLGHTPEKIQLANGAQIRENTKAIALGESRWMGVTKISSEGVYADPVLGNVIEHVAAETTAGKPVYIGTRLKVANGKITEVEINFDDGPRVNAGRHVVHAHGQVGAVIGKRYRVSVAGGGADRVCGLFSGTGAVEILGI
jgi:hypothetical protein